MIYPSAIHASEYRADIDGLRAVSVLSVVIYHAFPEWLSGGFIGVDVFFVISGFLISSILIKGMKNGDFRFADFYGRRIRRIFPALATVMLAAYISAWLILLPEELKALGKSTVAGAAFMANFLSWHEVGYFDAMAEEKPLLHLWSLGVEEQFYIVWPLLLALVWKRAVLMLLLTALLALASFIANVVLVHGHSSAAFYLPHSRFWELLCGSLLAWACWSGWTQHITRNRLIATACSWLGGLLILLGLLGIDKTTVFPGWAALLPVVGAVLVVGAGEQAWLNRIVLSNPLMVWLGLVSFPLYLWHWPLLSFVQIVQGEDSPVGIRLAAIVASVVLAWLTFRFIEAPLRRRSALWVVPALCLLMSLIGVAGYFAYKNNGFPSRKIVDTVIYEGDIGHSEYFSYLHSNYPVCADESVRKSSLVFEGVVRCRQSKPSDAVDIVLLGDSHAEHLFMGMADALPSKNLAFYIRDNPFHPGSLADVIDAIERSPSIKKVVFAVYWAWRMEQVPGDSTLAQEILRITQRLQDKGKQVYLVDDVPRYTFDPKKCGRRRLFSSEKPQCTIAEIDMQKDYDLFLNEIRKALRSDPRLRFLEIREYLCSGAECSMEMDGKLLYRDMNHLNIPGSIHVGKRLVAEHGVLAQSD